MTTPQSHPLDLLIKKLETHAPLGKEEHAILCDLPFKVRDVDAGAHLVREGDKPERCAVLVEGYAYRQKTTGDGARQILSIHIPGEAVDFQNMFLAEADHNVQMLTRGVVAEIPRQALIDLTMSNRVIGEAILVTTLVEASIFREWTLNIGRRNARERIAHLLCEFAVRLELQDLGPNVEFELPITQEQLADATGLTPVHVNRVLKSLQAEGVLERNRRTVRFPEWQRMRDIGDFSMRYLHVRETPTFAAIS
jgi:CRP-like cAMP-binding protein